VTDVIIEKNIHLKFIENGNPKIVLADTFTIETINMIFNTDKKSL